MQVILQAVRALGRKLEQSIALLRNRLDTVQKTAAATEALAQNNKTRIAAKMDQVDPVGSGSFSMNRAYGYDIGIQSHAEGNCCIASGVYSHAEGNNCQALGDMTHAEGNETVAKQSGSHAEGLCTVSSGWHSHVQGRYNLEDTKSVYAHIVGNGNEEKRSNAHTLDWSGNAWFAGRVETTYLILTSTGGKRYKVTVSDSGELSAVEANPKD
jgi:hypothetical protein